MRVLHAMSKSNLEIGDLGGLVDGDTTNSVP